MNKPKEHRRKFLQIGAATLLATFVGSLPKSSYPQPAAEIEKGIVVHEDEGIHIFTRRKIPLTVKISKARHGVDNISFCTEEMEPGRKMRVHKHLYNDELIFIHRGQGTLTLGEESIEVKTGTVAFIPRGNWHALDNTGPEKLEMIFQYTPAGFEEFFIENGTLAGTAAKERTAAEFQAAAKKYGMLYKDGMP